MSQEGAKNKIEKGSIVRFKDSAPDALFPPFSRDDAYEVMSVDGSYVNLLVPGTTRTQLPVHKKDLELVDDGDVDTGGSTLIH